MALGVTCDLAILSDFLNIEDMYSGTWNGKDPSLLLPGSLFLQMKATQRESRAKKNLCNQYFFLFLLKPFLVELLTFTIKRMLANIPLQILLHKKGYLINCGKF